MKRLTVLIAALAILAFWTKARAEANAAKDAAIPAEVVEFTAVVNGLVAGWDAISKAADGDVAGASAKETPKDGETKAEAIQDDGGKEDVKAGKHRSLKNSAILIAGGAGLGASVGKMTGKKNAVLIGAIAGGVAGLIYDRTTYKNPKGI